MSAGGRLVDAAGDVRLGIFAEPIEEVNHRDYALTDAFGRPAGRLARHFGFKQFEFLGALGEGLVFGCAVADIKYAGTAFVYCWEPASRRLGEWSIRRPLALGTHFEQRPERGATRVVVGRRRIRMQGEVAPRRRRLAVGFGDELAIDAVFDEEDPPLEPMRICTRAGAAGWVYARKTAGQRVTGSVVWAGRRYDLGALGLRGHHDWSAGYMRRHTFWNWGCLAGTLADGRVVGLNVSCGVNETSFTESCFWVDGRREKLDMVHFAYDRRDLMRPWEVRSLDGRLALAFHPEGRHVERVRALVVATDFQQLFGRYQGHLETAAGERIAIAGLLGYMERHYAKW